MKTPTAACALLALLVLPSCASVSQSEPPEEPWGKIVREIRIVNNNYTRDALILNRLKTRLGKPLRKEDLEADLRVLWKDPIGGPGITRTPSSL